MRPDLATQDETLLEAVPKYMALGTLLKAHPAEEGGERIIYLEASNEDPDYQREVMLQKALGESRDYYLRFGNIDLSHFTIIGARRGIPNFQDYEVGQPVDVRVTPERTFVKALLYRGESAQARNAAMVWDSLTQQTPPARWYASVGGAILHKAIQIDPETHERVAVIDRVRWTNTALDRTPVNLTVDTVSPVPIGVFAKSLGGYVLKDLTAGYGTDSAGLTGGAALRTQSLDGAAPRESVGSYWDFRDRMAAAIRRRAVAPNARAIAADAGARFGLEPSEAAEWTERFLRDLSDKIHSRNKVAQ